MAAVSLKRSTYAGNWYSHKKNSKIYLEIYRRLEGVSRNPYISSYLLLIFKFLNSCILFNIGSNITRPEIFPSLNGLFLTMWQ